MRGLLEKLYHLAPNAAYITFALDLTLGFDLKSLTMPAIQSSIAVLLIDNDL